MTLMKEGFGLLEIIIAVAIVSIAFIGLLSVSQTSLRMITQSSYGQRGIFLLEEGIEAARSLRDLGWSANINTLTANTTYYLVFNQGWSFQTIDPGAIDGIFTRTVVWDNVYRRNADDDIIPVSAPDPKTLDPDTKKITVTVRWFISGGTAETRSISTYLGNIFGN